MAFASYPDQIKKETVENLVETLIYEKVGTYIRKQIVESYRLEELEFADRCSRLLRLFETNVL